MAQSPDHYMLYEKISELIDYCNENDLLQTGEMLTFSISALCHEESKLHLSFEREHLMSFDHDNDKNG